MCHSNWTGIKEIKTLYRIFPFYFSNTDILVDIDVMKLSVCIMRVLVEGSAVFNLSQKSNSKNRCLKILIEALFLKNVEL